MPAGKGTYGSKKGRPKKRRQSPYANPIGKGKPPGELIKKHTGNPFSAGASITKKKTVGKASPKLKGKQGKLDANKGGKIGKADFAMLRKKKKRTV